MKNAFSTLADPAWSLAQHLNAAVKYGYDGIDLRGIGPELDITRHPDFTDRLDETLSTIAHHSLQIAGLSTSAACSVAPDKQQDHLDEVKRYCTLSAEILLSANVGRPWIRVFGGKIPEGVPFERALTDAADQLRRYGDIAAKRGDIVVVETHDDWCASERVRTLVEKADHPAVGIVWDVHHPWHTTGESPAQTWNTIGRYTRYVHLKDAKGGPKAPQQTSARPARAASPSRKPSKSLSKTTTKAG
ncbi:MAG: TIM barrel protein [Myxococcales bacterium]